MTGDQLALQAIASVDDSQIGELSPLGNALLGITRLAVRRASDGMSLSELAEAGAQVASQVMPLVQPAISGIVNELSSVVSSGSELAGVVPILGQAISFAGAIADAAAAQSAAEDAKNLERCHGNYFVDVLPGTGVGAERTPADIFGATDPPQVIHHTPAGRNWLKAGSTWVALPDSTVGRIFAVSSEDLIDSPYDQRDDGSFVYYPSYSVKAWIDRAVNLRKAMVVMGAMTPGDWGHPSGIPQDTRWQLRLLRSAITSSRRVSHSDPISPDGGKTLFPIYIDLYLSQLRQNRISKAWVHYVWATVLSGRFGDIDCTKVERRGIDQWDQMIRAWDLTANPLYGVDKIAMQALIAKLDHKVSRLAGLKGMTMPTTPTIAVQALPKLSAVTALLGQRGVSFKPLPLTVAKALGQRPKRAVVELAKEPGEDILALIRAAAHMPVHEEAEAVAVETVHEEAPDEVAILESVLSLLRQVEEEDEDATDTFDEIVENAESGDPDSIEIVGYMVALLDSIDKGLIEFAPHTGLHFDVYDMLDEDERAWDEEHDDAFFGDLFHTEACSGVGAVRRPTVQIRRPPPPLRNAAEMTALPASRDSDDEPVIHMAPLPPMPPPPPVVVPMASLPPMAPPMNVEPMRPIPYVPPPPPPPPPAPMPMPASLAHFTAPSTFRAIAPAASVALPPAFPIHPLARHPALTMPLVQEPPRPRPKPSLYRGGAASSPTSPAASAPAPMEQEQEPEYEGAIDDDMLEGEDEWDGALGYDWGGGDNDGEYPYDGSTYGWCVTEEEDDE